jgi:hypothetical protein
MSLTTMAMIGILLGFVFLVVGFLMEGPVQEKETVWNRVKAKKTKKRGARAPVLKKKAA